jgi:hypothetical protein
VPKLVEAFAGKKVVGASAGEFHTAMWTEDGEVFTFGKAAEYGSLGHGGGNDQRVPLVVEARSYGSVKPVFKPRGLGGSAPTAPLRRSGKEWANGPTTVVQK